MPRSSNFSPLRDVRWFSVHGGERKTDNGSPWALFKRPRAKLAEKDAKGCRVPRGRTSPRHDPFSTCCSPLRRLGAPTRMPLTRTPPLWRHTVALACAWQCIRDTHTHKLEHACTPQDPCASYPHPPRFVWFLYRWLFSTNHPHPTFLPTLFPSFPPPPSHLLFFHPLSPFSFLFFSSRDVYQRHDQPSSSSFSSCSNSKIHFESFVNSYECDTLFILELFYLSLKTGK